MNKYQILKKYFGYDSFREGQESLIDSILEGRDTLGIMPTGAGKSICYQVPAMLLSGITIVVSPLISLMNDQVRALKEVGIPAGYLNSSLTTNQYFKAIENAKRGMYRLLYVAPERLLTDSFLQFARQVEISMVTVDEAHCISQWGQDFRPSYLKILEFLEALPQRPVISAFTATATITVKEDIAKILALRNPNVLVTGFDRSNLYYEVRRPQKKMDALFDFIEEQGDTSGIIYCATRKNVEKVCDTLVANGYPATQYHAGLSDKERKQNQDDFIYDTKPIMVATNAFGMGIDKSNVRYVVHYNMPKDMESYYQEAGRAGRDGEPAKCLLLYHGQDVVINQLFIDHSNEQGEMDYITAAKVKQQDRERLKKMTFYCLTKDCLRKYILTYFGEKSDHYCGNCSNCLGEYVEEDVSETSRLIIGCVAEAEGRYGMTTIVDVLKGSNSEKVHRGGLMNNSYYGSLKGESVHRIRTIINMLTLDQYLISTTGKYPLLQVARLGRLFLQDEEGYILMKLAKEEYEPAAKSETTRRKTTESVRKKAASAGRLEKTTTNGKSAITRSGTTTKKTAKKTSSTKRTRAASRQNTVAAGLSSKQKSLFEKLRKQRIILARKQGLPPYMIFSDKSLVDMCQQMPKNREEMLMVNGVGEVKYDKYGEIFLHLING